MKGLHVLIAPFLILGLGAFAKNFTTECVDCSPTCEQSTGQELCDVCDPEVGCSSVIDNHIDFDEECNTCFDADAGTCTDRILTRNFFLPCADYCEEGGDGCKLSSAIDCSGCQLSNTSHTCDVQCNNKGCNWNEDACKCTCDCESDEDECRQPCSDSTYSCKEDGRGGCDCELTCDYCYAVCEPSTGTELCQACDPNDCTEYDDNEMELDEECDTCFDSDEASCTSRLLSLNLRLPCADYCEINDADDGCVLKDEVVCATGCEISDSYTTCNQHCDNKGCTWDEDSCSCECNCDNDEDDCLLGCEDHQNCAGTGDGGCGCYLTCTPGEDSCEACPTAGDIICRNLGLDSCGCQRECDLTENPAACSGGCSDDTMCGEDPHDYDGCICNIECDGDINPDACSSLCTPDELCEVDPTQPHTVCLCNLQCTVFHNPEACSLLDCPEACDVNLQGTACMCVPDCTEQSKCNNQSCGFDEHCYLNADKTECECSVEGPPPPACGVADCDPSCTADEICSDGGQGFCKCELECDSVINPGACSQLFCSAEEVCREEATYPPAECVCAPSCSDPTECGGVDCEALGGSCVLNESLDDCECLGVPEDEPTTSESNVMHAGLTVGILVALYSLST